MVDIHCHILPALDDGARDEAISIEMARMAREDGITHVVATPHSNYQYAFDPEVNRDKRDALQKLIGDSPVLLLGCDFHLSYENLEDIRTDPGRYTINGLQYLLVEFADSGVPPSMDQIFFDLISRKLVPIITHPERNPLLSRDLNLLQKWIGAGCFLQVTAGSFLGRFGKHAEKFSMSLLKHNMIHFIASDAHDTVSRPLQLAEARRVIAEAAGEETANALSEANPRATIEGRALPWRPELLPIVQERKWFSFRG
ncbi:MAG: exopolysaccharide biosynthesis protein [Acidobacteria bacterium]|nr:exopolysaccharide biosynthesis protein [Acidobacteriota bacterium]